MKKFKFSLDTVLDYKQQMLDHIMAEHAEIIARVHRQEQALRDAWQCYHDYNDEFCRRKSTGMTITEAMVYESGLRAQEMKIQRETERLKMLEAEEEKKREQVVEAKKETSSLEKLKEHKLEDYNKAVQKGEEMLIEEFVSSSRMTSGIA